MVMIFWLRKKYRKRRRSNVPLSFRFLLLILVFAGFGRSFAQDNLALHPWQIDTLVVPESKLTSFRFPGNHRIIDQSITVSLNQRDLEYPIEYRFDNVQNVLTFFLDINTEDTLNNSYQFLPVPVFLVILVSLPD